MAVNDFSGLTITNPQVGIQITKVTDSPSDWSSVANDTYFYDKTNGLVYYKNSLGIITYLFTENTDTNIYNADGTLDSNRIVNVDNNTLKFDNANIGINIDPTMPLEIRGTAIPSTNENLFRATVSDVSGAHFTIQNGTTADGQFQPKVYGRQSATSNGTAVVYAGIIDSTQDSGTTPVTTFQSHLDTLVPVATRPLFQWKNWSTDLMTMLANGNLGIGTATPTEKLDIAGKTKTTTFQMTTSPAAGYVMTSDASGNGTWASPINGSSLEHGIASGTSIYTVTIPGVTAYTDGDAYLIRFTNGNDADSTININSLGAIPLVKKANAQVTGGDIVAGQEVIIIYDGTNFQCIQTTTNQLFAYVTNDDSVTITKGQPVYAFGAAGNRMSVKLANNVGDATSAQTIGLVFSSSIAPNQRGFVITQGVIDGLDTSMYSAGNQLYLGATAGALTNVKPYAPNHLVYIGIVERVNAGNGQIYVKPQNGYELDELHDVDLISNPPINGQVLGYNAVTNLWEPLTIPGSTPSGTQLLTGGASWSGTGMVFNVSTLTYTIDGNYYSSAPQNITLAAGDPSNPRFDAIVVDDTGTISVITGTPSANPIVPSIPGTQVLVQYVLVAAGATTPTITNEYVYREGSVPDWTQVVIAGSAPTMTANFSSTTPTPFQGAECLLVNAPSYTTSKRIRLTKPSGSISRSDFPFLSFRVYLPVAVSPRNILVRAYNNTTYIGAVYATTWGFSNTTTGTWQLVTIPVSQFGNPTQLNITRIEFLFSGTATTTDQFAFDDIKFQSGYGPQSTTSTIDILDSGTVVGSTAKLNFIDGTNTTAVVTQDVPNNKIDVRIDANISSGAFGVANSSGVYAYYSTLQAAITAAVAGQTVEVFTDYIETSDTSVILKLGVNIQGNGHTYTLTGNGTASCLIDNGVTASCKINNYHLVRTSTTGYDTINKSALNLTGGSIVDCSGSTFTGTSATAVIINGPVKVSNVIAFGSTAPQIYISSSGAVVSNVYAQNTTGASASYTGCIVNGGILQNATAHHTGGNPAISNGSTGKAISCRAYAIGSSVTAFDNSGIAQDCHGNSSGGIGFSCYINSISENCSGYSSATHGISINGGVGARLLNCNGYSTVGAGIYSYNGFIMNCNGYSTATSGIIATNGNDGLGQALNCTAISDSASGFQLSTQNAYLVSNCTIISRFASSSGHGLAISNTALHTVIGNTIQVTSNTANCISGASSTTIKYSQNKLIGALTPVNVNISQSVINTEDAYGNITL